MVRENLHRVVWEQDCQEAIRPSTTATHLIHTRRGSTAVTDALANESDPLVICGHVHWDDPLGTLPSGAQVLNVDSRAVLLTGA